MNRIPLAISGSLRHHNSTDCDHRPAPVDGFPSPPLPANPDEPPALRLLLVEDDPPTLLMLARLLRMDGYLVSTAASVTDALRLSQGIRFDLLIADVGLPDGNGCDLLGRLQQIRPLRGIAMTGYDDEQGLAHCREAGFLEQLVKPIDFSYLEQIIRRVMAAPVMS